MLMHQDRPLPEPMITPENQVFFDATKTGKFMLRRCDDCGKAHYYPRTICPLCGSDKTQWIESTGKGEIYSYSVLRKGVEIPYCLAYVNLAEGVSVLTNIVDCDFDMVHVGQAVALSFKATDKGQMIPMFRPV
jgi:uncharacterized protein